jgi:aldo/keto reductase family protein
MEALVDERLTTAIGLSDIDVDGVREIVDTARIKPAVVEVEAHPYHPQWELHELCKAHGIILLAFASLGTRWNRHCSTTLSSSRSLGVWKRPRRKYFWHGVSNVAAPCSRHRSGRSASARTSTSRRFPMTRIQEINEHLTTCFRFNSVVDAGEPGFAEVPQGS